MLLCSNFPRGIPLALALFLLSKRLSISGREMSALIVAFRLLNTVPLFNDVEGNGRWE